MGFRTVKRQLLASQVPRLLLRPAEVAQMIGLSRAQVYILIKSGALPAVRLPGGRLIRVPMSAVQELVDQAAPIQEDQPSRLDKIVSRGT